MFYGGKEVAAILKIGTTKAYQIIKELGDQLESQIIPGTNRHYMRPPRGKIQKSVLCEAYQLDRAECDALLATKS